MRFLFLIGLLAGLPHYVCGSFFTYSMGALCGVMIWYTEYPIACILLASWFLFGKWIAGFLTLHAFRSVVNEERVDSAKIDKNEECVENQSTVGKKNFDSKPSIKMEQSNHRTNISRYVWGVSACITLLVLYAFIGAELGWKRGGGLVPLLIFLAITRWVWRSITKREIEHSIEPERDTNYSKENSVPPVDSETKKKGQGSEKQNKKPEEAIIIIGCLLFVFGLVICAIICPDVLKSEPYDQKPIISVVENRLPAPEQLTQKNKESNDESISSEIYSTKGHMKAKGIDLKIEYPKGWKRSEGKRPNIVQVFSEFTENQIKISCIIQINDSTPEQRLFSFDNLSNKEQEEYSRKNLPPSYKVIDFGLTKLEGITAMKTCGEAVMERAGFRASIILLIYQIPYDERMISIGFSVAGKETSKEAVAKVFKNRTNLFKMMLNSVILNNRYEQ